MQRRILSLLCVVAILMGMITMPAAATTAEGSLQDQVNAYTSGVITLTENAEDLKVDANTYIDLNGHSIAGITVADGATVYVSDSQTDDYTVADGVYGAITGITGAVEASQGYVAVEENNTVSFHRVDLAIKSMSLRPGVAGVYYTSSFAADEVVSAKVESYGVALSVVEAPTAENLDVHCGYSVLYDFGAGEKSGTLLTGIMDAENDAETNAAYAAMDIYGSAYIKTAEGYTFGAVVVRNLQQQVEAIDAVLGNLNATQKAGIAAFYNTYKAAMESWNIPNLRGEQLGDIVIAVPVKSENGVVTETVTVEADGMSITVPFGTLLAAGATELTLNVTKKAQSDSGIEAADGETLMPFDVHVDGISSENTVPLTVALGKVMPENLNMGNYSIYHVEADGTKEMTLVSGDEEFTAHNQFKYTLDGELTLHMATFSEVAALTNDTNVWNGGIADSFDGGTGAEADPYLIRNADQLAYLNVLVSAENEDYAEASYKLLSDIDFGGEENSHVWYPIGYWNQGEGTNSAGEDIWYTYGGAFMGTFDGNGHKISNIYQNTWIMDGNYDYGYWDEAMGLFGYVYEGTVKNLTVENFSSDGEFTPTGCVTAYATDSTFENISLVNCNPRVYNTGNGGIVGIGGISADTEQDKLTFNNITIDNTNKITALWGSWDVACGGLVGMFRGAGHVYMNNCHVAAQIDVYNDVCGNYQYYWYRYSGMLIGTNKNMITDKDGYTVPETSKFHATNCTVHFGNWNDYYYCELVANSLASYTHDHQFSRLTEIKSLDEINDGATWTKTGNFVLFTDSTRDVETATCFHIVKAEDGSFKRHMHEDEGTEIVNGETVLKENNQIVYLPFNQLFTGYGWGVKHIPIYDDGTPNPFEGVTILGREVANSVDKFEIIANGNYETETTVTIGDLFKAKEQSEVAIVPENVQVTVSPANDESTASGTYKAAQADENGNVDWTQGTLTFSGIGDAIITITDYYFCTPTTITVTINDRQPVEKFDIVMNNGDFLHRVGNTGTVALDKLFKAKDDVVGNVSVSVEPVNDTGASGTYDNNAIQFNGTGVVKVTIKDDDEYCQPTELYLEVVDAKNITAAENAESNNVVLLNNITASSLTISNGYTFYGNGFEIKFNGDGSYRNAAVSYGFVTMESGTLDNVRVICKIFPQAYMFANEMTAGSDGRYPYGYSAVIVSGNSTISNSYIYGARNNIQVGAGNIKIQNTVTANGSLSNIHILSESGNTVVLDDVTTVQWKVADDFGVGNTMLGFGILVGTNETKTYPTIKITGNLKQYNWVSKADASAVTNTYAKEAINSAVNNEQYVHNLDGVDKINLGVVFLTTETTDIQDSRPDSVKEQVPYELDEVVISLYKGQVYSVMAGSAITEDSGHDAEKDGVIPYAPNAQNAILPQVTHSGVNGSSLTIKTEFDKEWITTFTADLDNIAGGSYTFKFSDLVVEKFGEELTYTIKDASGNTVEKNAEQTLNQLHTSEYTLVVTDNVIYNDNGQLSDETVTHEMPFVLYATKTSIDPPKFEGIGSGVDGAIRLVSTAGGNWRPAYPALEGVSVTYWSQSQGKMATLELSTLTDKGTISGQKWTYTCDDYTLTITGGPVHTTTSYVLSPMIATRDGNKILYFAGANKDNSTGTTARLICLEYVFTDKNASTTVGQCTKYGDGIATVQYADLSEYSWSSFKNGKVEAVSSDSGGTCVTPDTLVTLADGTQKEIQYLSVNENILAWDFFKGEATVVPASVVVNHGYDEWNVIKLTFADGSTVKAVNAHAFFDADLNRFVKLTPENAADYVGHKFVKMDGGNTVSVELVACDISKEYIESYSAVSAYHYNFMADDFFSLTNEMYGLVAGIEVGEGLKYDEKILVSDIAQYGLYTYEDFAPYLTELEYAVFSAPYVKISVEKGYITWEKVLALIEEFLR